MPRRLIRSLFALAIAVFPLVVLADPPDAGTDPALEIIERLLAQLQAEKKSQPAAAQPAPPAPAPAPVAPADRKLIDPIAPPKPAEEPATADAVIDDIASRSADQAAKRAKNSLVLLEQARAAEKAGKLAEAIRLAGSARRLDPNNGQIAAYLAALQKAAGDAKAESSAFGKPAAHLAAGLTRGQILMERGRFTDAADLLAGVVRAADLFPPDANVAIYKRLALKELEGYKARVESGLVQPEQSAKKPPTPADEPILVSTGSAAPESARRILRSIEARTPAWYAQAKNRLAFRMTVNYTATPAALVFEDIARQTGLKIVIDEPILHSRAHLNNKIDLRVSDVPAETVLNLACIKSGLEYVIMERAIVITTPARAVRYIQDLSDAVRDNWAAARVLFPESNPELFAAPPLPNALPGQAVVDRAELDRDVPPYLLSGDALVKDIQSLLR